MDEEDDGLGVATYRRLALWQRRDVSAALAVLPIAASVGWSVGGGAWYALWGATAVALALAIAQLLAFWFMPVYAWARLAREGDPKAADVALVEPNGRRGKAEVCAIQRSDAHTFFEFWHARYELNNEGLAPHGSRSCGFVRLRFDAEIAFREHLGNRGHGAGTDDLIARWGRNEFRFERPQFLHLLGQHMLAPFFVFQVFCVALWCLDEYWYYSMFTLFMLMLFECTVVQQRRRNLQTLENMGHTAQDVLVHREGRWVEISERLLLPGDLVSLRCRGTQGQAETTVPADCLLLSGKGITNESILTGESIPQWKVSIKDREGSEVFLWSRDKQHVLYRGTTLIQHEADQGARPKTTDGGLLAQVLSTGFNTTQGDLMRTLLHSTDRMSANSREAGLFILFLMVFAFAAAGYVLYHGLRNPERNNYQLLLNCIMIVTSVIPPELPMELSLAVNQSMLSLFKKSIFCTEPFRIPFAGKADACCFDKTGTLTSSRLIFEGIADVGTSSPIDQGPEEPQDDHEAIKVLVGCHSLVAIDGKMRGDPMERAAFKSLAWTFAKDLSRPRKGSAHKGCESIRILRRFHFNPVLKRMSAVIRTEPTDSESQPEYFLVTKGAPESIETCIGTVPKDYSDVYRKHAQRGYRVLALACRKLDSVEREGLYGMSRSDMERGLRFSGFAVFSCPMKPMSRDTLLCLKQAQHKLFMITGDAMLTACHAAEEVHIADKMPLILQPRETQPGEPPRAGDGESSMESLEWVSRDGSVDLAFDKGATRALSRDYTLCIPGRLVTLLKDKKILEWVVPFASVFARTSPEEKEVVIKTLKGIGHTVLMCGDGTNDVGALKTSHVGVALLNSRPANQGRVKVSQRRKNKRNRGSTSIAADWMASIAEEEEDDGLPVVNLGDASIASPFTARYNIVTPCIDVIKQGRSTLVTYVQMFKILGINCLSSAYCMSVMYLNGVKLGDTQATVSGILIAFLFMFLSSSKPHKDLSSRRPHSKVFCAYTMLSILGQFGIHLAFLITTYEYAMSFSNDNGGGDGTAETQPQGEVGSQTDVEVPATDFKPNIVNSVSYLVNFIIQLSTFAVNYVGEPFNASMWENKGLSYGLAFSAVLVVLLISGAVDGMNEALELVELPRELKNVLFGGGLLTWLLTFALERALRRAFPERLHWNCRSF